MGRTWERVMMLVRWMVAVFVPILWWKSTLSSKKPLFMKRYKRPFLYFHHLSSTTLHTQFLNVTVNDSHPSKALSTRAERHGVLISVRKYKRSTLRRSVVLTIEKNVFKFSAKMESLLVNTHSLVQNLEIKSTLTSSRASRCSSVPCEVHESRCLTP